MNERLRLQDLVELLAQKEGITKKDADLFLKELLLLLTENIENLEPIKIKDFGTLKPIKISARKSIDVNTGEEIEISAHYRLGFTPDKILRDLVNKPFSHFESVVIEDGVSFENIEDEIADLLDNTKEKVEDDLLEDESEETILPLMTDEIIEAITNSKEEYTEEISTILITQKSTADNLDTEDKNIEIGNKASYEQVTKTNETSVDKATVQTNKEHEVLSNTEQLDKSINIEIPIDNYNIKKKSMNNKKKIIISASVILIIAIGLWIYTGYFEKFMVNHGIWYHVITPPEAGRPDSKPSFNQQTTNSGGNILESHPQVISDTTNNINQEIGTEMTRNEDPSDVNTTNAVDKSEIKIKIESGNTLRALGLEYFGNKVFWVYIYEENKDIIKNPNNVPIGTQITIPASSKYRINAKDPKSIEKAKQLEQQLYKDFGI